ncbi:MAG: NAD-glutamate dehydrogenase [Panacagrimonas sp.]|nr:NAD-glutamate dehydrogenase [Panacagrimonas sp.]
MQDTDADQNELLDQIADLALAAAGPQAPPGLHDWVRRYYASASRDTLAARTPEDLAAMALAHLDMARRRAPGSPLVRVLPAREAGLASVETCVDDMPFLVDTLVMAVREAGGAVDWSVHPLCRVQRDIHGALVSLDDAAGAIAESWIHLEFEALPDAAAYPRLVDSILSRLQDLHLAVTDYGAMRQRLRSVIDSLRDAPAASVEERDERMEAAEFLSWLDDGHFTFLASARTVFETGADGRRRSVPRPDQGLGLARPGARFADMDALIAPREQLEKYAESPRVLVLTKAAQRATVHHPEYMDHVAVRYIAPDGRPQGVVRLIGQFSSEAYVERPWEIPLVRRKVEQVMQRSQLRPGSHSAKNLREILHALPRDELFQSSESELFDTCMGIRALRDRHPLRLFLRRDRYGRFFSALVYLPRERYSRELRDRVSQELLAIFGGQSLDRSVEFMRGGLARVHVVVRTPPGTSVALTPPEIERRLQLLARPWRERLLESLRAATAGEVEVEALASRFGDAFAASYTERVSPGEAATDVLQLARLSDSARVRPSLQLRGGRSGRLKLYAWQQPLALADVLPVLENFGVRALRQDPEAVRTAGSDLTMWIQDFEVELPAGEGEDRTQDFEQTLLAVLDGVVEDDALNRLVLAAGLDGRQVSCLRMLAKYVNQMGLPYGRAEIERTLAQNPAVAGRAMRLFEARFDPQAEDAQRDAMSSGAQERLDAALDAVAGLDEDRILRSLVSVIGAGLRTNYYQRREDGGYKEVISFKLDPRQVNELPQPRPRYEIWVYSPRMEGVHLRGGPVARGGLRWSDRREDFRTEVLGLMKAQSVKNAVIVPVGAKGGFVVKRGPPPSDRDAWLRNGTECYRSFLRGLLDITDNRVSGALVPPPLVRRHDGDDPYLVVAADKGTATFSDIANGIAQEYGFWLGDAFASGGSAGYDHKKMGITARGGWESVKRHFRELGRDIQSEPFTVVGVGDMSGDVFGNGMLLSRQIRLVAAFDHRHVFVDPDPNAATSFAERERLFALPRSSWADYDTRLLSRGGGVFPRTAKLVKLSPEARAALDVEREALSPNELIRAILRAPIDLLWNGGIGTYVKAHDQSHEQARDRSNDAVRVDGRELRARVVGEGGNLGLTQAGRIEYAARGGADGRGGRINTDAIDNSGGVHSSDREVNIKIPLNLLMREGGLERDDRDRLLASMTEDVARAVLRDNEVQSGCISQVEAEAVARLDEHAALIRRFEREGRLDRALEGLPDEDELQARRAEGRGLLRPEIAVIVAYAKLSLFEVAMESGLAADAHFEPDLLGYFPPALVQRFKPALESHLLGRELVSTILANRTVNRMGPTFVHRLAEDRGLTPGEVLKAYAAAEALFDAPSHWTAIERLPHTIPAELQYRLMLQVVALLRHVAGSIAGSAPLRSLALGPYVARYAADVARMRDLLPGVLPRDYRDDYDRFLADLQNQSVPAELAAMLTRARALGSALDIADLAAEARVPLEDVARVYFSVGEALRLPWMLSAIIRLKAANSWQALARARLREDAYRLHRLIAGRVLAINDVPPASRFERWSEQNGARLRLSLSRLAELQSSSAVDYAGLAVAVRELHDLQAL